MTKLTGNSSKEMIRRMIREAVRSRMGLLTEAAQTREEGDYKLTVTGDTVARVDFETSAPEGEMLLSFTVKNSKNELVKDSNGTESYINRETRGSDIPDGSIAWLRDSPADTYAFIAEFGTFDSSKGQSKVEKILAADLTLEAVAFAPPEAANSPAADASAVPAPVAPVSEPQTSAKSMSIQDKIRTSAKAIQDDFDDVYTDGINLEVVKTNNAYDDHTWVDSSSGKSQFGLNDFSTGKGYNDAYTYFALVNNDSQKPIAFVVASDPKADGHFSTGRFIGPTSQRSSLKNAFCVLYHRATGEVHPSCNDGASTGSEDDKYGKSGGSSRGSENAGSNGSEDDGSSGSAATSSDSSSGSTAPGGTSLGVVTRNGQIIRGTGDAKKRGAGNYSLERVSNGGKKFYTRSRERFGSMGLDEAPTPIILKRDQEADGLDPITLVVTFRNPVKIDPDAIAISPDGKQKINRQVTTLSPNTTKEDIASIGFYYKRGAANLKEFLRLGKPRSPKSDRYILTAKNDPAAFKAAASWIYAHPEQFDLAEDLEFSVPEKPDAGDDSRGTGAIPAEQRGMTMDESVSRRSLLDLYRF